MTETPSTRPEPFWFGESPGRCFGMLHRSAVPSTRGVVICNTLGFEGLLTHRPFRHLAERLAAGGQSVLRFDYSGTGDSAGGEWEPGRVKAWLHDIGEAVAVLRASTGATEIQLVGFRIGATLAHVYARDHREIGGLALWTPCVTGKGYARELKALSRLSGANRPVQRITSDWFPEDSIEAVGYEFTAATLEELAELDLLDDASPAPTGPVLVVDRDDAPPNDPLVSSLTAAGVDVEHRQVGGFLEFMTDDETTSVMPNEALDVLATWLAAPRTAPAIAAEEPTADDVAPVDTTLVVHDARGSHLFAPGSPTPDVVERTTWIDDRLFAIVSRPADPPPGGPTRVVVLLNTGSANRSGPGRLYVTLARHWAGAGFTVARVDLGGAGDSVAEDPATENKPYAPDRARDVAAVMTWARTTLAADELTSFGICSGAYNSFRAALEPVVPIDRVILVNPLIFHLGTDTTVGESSDKAVLSANMLSRGMGNKGRWKRLMNREESLSDVLARVRRLYSEGALRGFAYMARAWIRDAAERVGLPVRHQSEVARDLRHLADEGVDVVLVFAADEPGSRYLKVMGGTSFDRMVREERVKLIEIDGGDHVFSPPGARQCLIETTTDHLLSSAPRPATHGHLRPHLHPHPPAERLDAAALPTEGTA